MRLLIIIATAECRLLLRRRSTWLLFALFAALVITAGWLGHERQVREQAQQAGYQRLVREQWENQPGRHPHRVSHYGTFAFKPRGPLAAFDPGVESYAGRVQYLEAHRQNAANFPEAAALSSAFRLGELSPAFVWQLVLPLVIIALGYRLQAGEAESGRLRLLLAQGVPPRTLALGKLAGLAATLTPFLVLAAIAGALLLSSSDASEAQLGTRLAVLAGALALHATVWTALTLWVSTRARTDGQAFAVLLSLWLAFCVVIPRAAAAAAASRYPLPGKSDFTAAIEEEINRLGDPHEANGPLFAALKTETLTRYGVSKVEDLPVNYGAMVMAHGEALSAGVFNQHFAALEQRFEAQNAFVQRAVWLDPVLALRALSTAASGTDFRAQMKFQRDAEAFRYAFVQHLNALHRDKIKSSGDRDQRLAAEHWRAFADFRATPLPLNDALRGTAACWFALALWALVPLLALIRLRTLRP